MKVSKVTETARIPTRKNPTDAGLDLYSDENVTVLPNSYKIVSTGVKVEIPRGYCGQVWPKSKNNHLVGAGIVDSEYQGIIYVKIVNPYTEPITINRGDGIAQLVLTEITIPEVLEVRESELYAEASSRGETGGIVTQVSQMGFLELVEQLTFFDPENENI